MPGFDPISAAILGGAGIITNLVGASKAAKAAKEAAALQVAATQRGQTYADQAYADQRSLLDPYVRMGQLSLAQLQAQKFGGTREQYLPSTPPPTSAPQGGPPLSGNARAIADAYQANLGRAPSLAEIQNRLNDPNFDILRHQKDIAGSPEANAFTARGGNQALAQAAPVNFPAPQPPPQGGGMVSMVGPDGSRKDVPAAMVGEAMRRGARVA